MRLIVRTAANQTVTFTGKKIATKVDGDGGSNA
jgi:hypothetical protein